MPADVPTCKKTNLFVWLSETVSLLNQDKEGVTHCWEQTQRLRAWERKVQVEASQKVKELFPNLSDVPAVDLDQEPDGRARDMGSEDAEAGELGVPFTQTEDDEEWTGWVGGLGGPPWRRRRAARGAAAAREGGARERVLELFSIAKKSLSRERGGVTVPGARSRLGGVRQLGAGTPRSGLGTWDMGHGVDTCVWAKLGRALRTLFGAGRTTNY